MDLQALLLKALNAALESGREIMGVYASEFTAELKADKSPVTQADKLAHEVIQKALAHIGFPYLSEEGKAIPYEERKHWGTFWLVDPLDGTKEFLNKNGEFTVNIALIHERKPVLGVVYAPALKALYFAGEGFGAYKSEQVGVRSEKLEDRIRNSKKLKVQEPPKEGGILRVVASRSHLSPETEEFIERLEVDHKVELVSAGSSLKFCLVAEGKADIYPRFAPTMEWDTAAGQAVVEQAGGFVLDRGTGKPIQYNRDNLLNQWFVAGKKKIVIHTSSKAII